jgi:uncharacterized protein
VGREVIEITETEEGVTFAVRVTPRASRDALEGEYQGALKVRLTAPPVDGRANDVLRRLLADRLGVPMSVVTIIAGETSRTKRVSVSGVSRARVIESLFQSAKHRA